MQKANSTVCSLRCVCGVSGTGCEAWTGPLTVHGPQQPPGSVCVGSLVMWEAGGAVQAAATGPHSSCGSCSRFICSSSTAAEASGCHQELIPCIWLCGVGLCRQCLEGCLCEITGVLSREGVHVTAIGSKGGRTKGVNSSLLLQKRAIH
jgi:hypothetical protein